MASNEPHPPPRSWKPEVEPDEAKRGAGPMWRRDRAAVPVVGVRTRRSRMLIGGAAFLFCTALLVWVSFWLWPVQRASLILIGAGYETNLAVPPNVYGRESLAAFADLSRSNPPSAPWLGSALLKLKQEPTEFRTDLPWDRGLESFAEPTVILYFALHGGSDGQGPYLLAHDADLRDRKSTRLNSSHIQKSRMPSSA